MKERRMDRWMNEQPIHEDSTANDSGNRALPGNGKPLHRGGVEGTPLKYMRVEALNEVKGRPEVAAYDKRTYILISAKLDSRAT
jgi:hypothetical protein